MEFFDRLVAAWVELSTTKTALLVEDSPWAYLRRHAVHLAPDVRARCHAALATLLLPDFTVILNTSGVEVGHRHPIYRNKAEEYSPLALR